MWWIVDRSCADRVDDAEAEAMIEGLIAVIDRLKTADAVFSRVYAARAAGLVRMLEERGYVVRWGD